MSDEAREILTGREIPIATTEERIANLRQDARRVARGASEVLAVVYAIEAASLEIADALRDVARAIVDSRGDR